MENWIKLRKVENCESVKVSKNTGMIKNGKHFEKVGKQFQNIWNINKIEKKLD